VCRETRLDCRVLPLIGYNKSRDAFFCNNESLPSLVSLFVPTRQLPCNVIARALA